MKKPRIRLFGINKNNSVRTRVGKIRKSCFPENVARSNRVRRQNRDRNSFVGEPTGVVSPILADKSPSSVDARNNIISSNRLVEHLILRVGNGKIVRTRVLGLCVSRTPWKYFPAETVSNDRCACARRRLHFRRRTKSQARRSVAKNKILVTKKKKKTQLTVDN